MSPFYWIFLHFFLLKMDQSLSSECNRSQDFDEESDKPPFVAPLRPLESTSTTTKVTHKDPGVDPDHASNFLTLPDCDGNCCDHESGDSDCEDFENATHHIDHDDLAIDKNVEDTIYDDGVATSTAHPEGMEEMDFVYGDIPILNRKVVNARRVNILEHPYVVNIVRNYSHYLVGTLITRNLVVTVAHPLHGVPIYELGLLLGETYSDRRSNNLMTVILLLFHRRFNPYTLENNILVIRFITDSYKAPMCSVKPIAIKASSKVLEGQTALLTGWGRCDSSRQWCVPRTSRYFFGELMDSMLRTISFTYQRTPSPEACQWYPNNGVPLSSDMVCLGPSREKQPHAPCLGAPGAPLVVGGHLVAMLAWGAGCGYYNDKPLIYTSVVDYAEWLQGLVLKVGLIRSPTLQPFFQQTQNYIRKEYVYENRKIQPTKIVNTNVDMLPMVAQEFDYLACTLADNFDATVYDIRDFIENGRFQAKKKELYDILKRTIMGIPEDPEVVEFDEVLNNTPAQPMGNPENDKSFKSHADLYLDNYYDEYS